MQPIHTKSQMTGRTNARRTNISLWANPSAQIASPGASSTQGQTPSILRVLPLRDQILTPIRAVLTETWVQLKSLVTITKQTPGALSNRNKIPSLLVRFFASRSVKTISAARADARIFPRRLREPQKFNKTIASPDGPRARLEERAHVVAQR